MDTIKTDKGYFVKTEKQFVESLFNAKTTPLGFFKKTKNCIKFFNMQNQPIFYIAKNKYNEIINGSLSLCNGKFYYMHGFNDNDKKTYFSDNQSYLYNCNLVKDIFNSAN